MNTSSQQHPFDLLLDIDKRSREDTQSAPEAAQSPDTEGRLALRLGAWHLMFFLQDVSEIIPLPRITRVPGVKSWLLGIANLRGTVISIIDLRDFFESRPTTPSASSRIVVVRSNDWGYGLLIDEVIGMRHFGPETRIPTLDAIHANLRPYITDAFHSENKEWLVFNPSQLLKSSQFLVAVN